MKLNQDCLRAVLLYLEANCGYEEDSSKVKCIGFRKVCNTEELQDYNHNDIIYCIEKLFEANYINGTCSFSAPNTGLVKADIYSLTMEGHNLIDTISNETIWNGIKEKLKTAGKVSVPIISTIAGRLGSEYLMEMLKMNK